MLDTLVKCAGVAGFFMATMSLGWQIVAYWYNRKEFICGEISCGGRCIGPACTPIHGVFLELYNNGNVPVYIESVSLTWGDEKAKTELHFQPLNQYDAPLKQGDARRCYVLRDDFPMLTEACKQPENKIWISVKSAKGEVLRIKGDKVLCLIKDSNASDKKTPDSVLHEKSTPPTAR